MFSSKFFLQLVTNDDNALSKQSPDMCFESFQRAALLFLQCTHVTTPLTI